MKDGGPGGGEEGTDCLGAAALGLAMSPKDAFATGFWGVALAADAAMPARAGGAAALFGCGGKNSSASSVTSAGPSASSLNPTSSSPSSRASSCQALAAAFGAEA